jgi:phospholipid transport system substrate-binding protein
VKRNRLNAGGFALIWLALMWAIPLQAGTSGPLELVDRTVRDVVADMNERHELYSADEAALRAMVLERVAPYFNFDRMTQLALARHWREATPDQRRQVSSEMLQLMVRTYANAMFTYRNHPLNLVDEKILSARSAVVRLSVKTDSGQKVSVILRLENRNEQWQVIDIVIDGVSMVITYRGTFAQEISKGGIEGLIDSIRKENLARATP